jgi:hypothetical protein
MIVELDLNMLKEVGMSPDDFTYLYLVYKKGNKYNPQLNLKPNLDKLQEEGYIKLGDTKENHVIRHKFLDLFLADFDKMFNELMLTYPMKVNSDKGVRILHAKDPNSKSNQKAKARYKRIVDGKPHVHKKIIACLNTQLKLERNNLGYMQNLETWINNHTWEKYENLDENDTRDKTKPRITRSL